MPTLSEAVETFILTRRVANCSPRTLDGYSVNLVRLLKSVTVQALPNVTAAVIQQYLTDLRNHMKPVSVTLGH